MADLSLFDKVTLTSFPHGVGSEGICAIELLHLVATGVIDNKTPECLTECCAILSAFDDSTPWRDNTQRTAVLIPYLRRLISCARDQMVDIRRAFSLADYTCRTMLPEFLDASGKGRTAVELFALPRILDAGTARKASEAVSLSARRTDAESQRHKTLTTRALIDDATYQACHGAASTANCAAEGYAGDAAGKAGSVALWIARAVCYANASPIRFWGSLGRPVTRALTDRAGRAAGGAVIEHYSRAMLDIILEAR